MTEGEIIKGVSGAIDLLNLTGDLIVRGLEEGKDAHAMLDRYEQVFELVQETVRNAYELLELIREAGQDKNL